MGFMVMRLLLKNSTAKVPTENITKIILEKKAEELADNNQNIVLDTLATNQSNNGNAGSVDINVYGYGSHGIYHDYDHFYWGSYYHRPWWRHHRYRPWNYWPYHYEPYYHGWSYYNTYYFYYPYYYLATILITITMEIITTPILINM